MIEARDLVRASHIIARGPPAWHNIPVRLGDRQRVMPELLLTVSLFWICIDLHRRSKSGYTS
jgi:hypothetical protein